MESPVVCTFCKEPVRWREDLITAGRSVVPFHAECFPKAKQGSFVFRLAYRINGWGFWFYLVSFNAVVLSLPLIFKTSRLNDVRWLALVATLGLVIPRLISWFGFERKLPLKPKGPRWGE